MRETELKCKAIYLSSLFEKLSHYESSENEYDDLLEIISKELKEHRNISKGVSNPSKTSELMMKVSVSVELKEISTEDLQNELLSRQREIHDIEKEILVLWANGKSLQELVKKYGEFADTVIDGFKNKKFDNFSRTYDVGILHKAAGKGVIESLKEWGEREIKK
ncbi:hypothetical protein [Fusobacterium ulcerans]|uniref:hypothetical protein n=1 Tax=Fusobacterium ulcerans TaxID=861 RepID=UPI003FF117E3